MKLDFTIREAMSQAGSGVLRSQSDPALFRREVSSAIATLVAVVARMAEMHGLNLDDSMGELIDSMHRKPS